MPMFVAFVAVVAVPALPSIETPVRLWVALPRFRAMAVVPTYRVELPKTPEGMVPDRLPAGRLVRLAPEPLKTVDSRVPVLGVNFSLVDETYSVVRLPAVWLANRT